MKKLILIIIISINTFSAFSVIINVKQDGTGDYQVIQEAVNASSDSDTVLVWPGTYYENVDFAGKNITLGSLFINTQDEAYKHTTIINGNKQGSCVNIDSGETETEIIGFTLTNGSGTHQPGTHWHNGGGINVNGVNAIISDCIIKENNTPHGSGGGIYIRECDINITNCRIYNNTASLNGGGIYCIWYSYCFISNTGIYNNHAQDYGGGIGLGFWSEMLMDEENRCNIYLNYAKRGCDFIKSQSDQIFNLVIDTFSVIPLDRYFASCPEESSGYELDVIELDALNAKLKPYDGDLYVNPFSGSDENDGINIDNPLKTIAFALTKIAIDSLENNNIYLANGIYSDSANNEKFPLNLRPFINMVGQSMEGVIFDGQYKTSMFMGNNEVSNYSFKNITLTRGRIADYEDVFNNSEAFGLSYFDNENITFDSITFDNAVCKSAYTSYAVRKCNNARFNNCIFKNIKGERSLDLKTWADMEDTLRANNCIFQNNKPDENHPDNWKMGGGIRTGGIGVIIVNNSLFDNNDTDAFLSTSAQTFITNCTFVNNSHEVNNTSAIVYRGGNSKMYNCIMQNNGSSPIRLGPIENTEAELHVYNSLLEGGISSITLAGESTLYYDTTNIDADPNFLGMWDHPYQIADGSPCIDAGILANLPDFIQLPEFDLTGNPRIVGDSIDMGAYEWNETIVGFNEIGPGSEKEKPKLLTAAPNPFSISTRISIKYKTEETVKVEIYDSFGHRVKTMLNSSLPEGNYELKWDGTDNNGNQLPKGIYFAIMFYGEKEVESLKLLKN